MLNKFVFIGRFAGLICFVSTTNPDERVRVKHKGSYVQVEPVMSIQCEDASEFVSRLISLSYEHHVKGRFFKLTDEQLKKNIELVKYQMKNFYENDKKVVDRVWNSRSLFRDSFGRTPLETILMLIERGCNNRKTYEKLLPTNLQILLRAALREHLGDEILQRMDLDKIAKEELKYEIEGITSWYYNKWLRKRSNIDKVKA